MRTNGQDVLPQPGHDVSRDEATESTGAATITCPCGSRLRLKSNFPAQSVKCPSCRVLVPVPLALQHRMKLTARKRRMELNSEPKQTPARAPIKMPMWPMMVTFFCTQIIMYLVFGYDVEWDMNTVHMISAGAGVVVQLIVMVVVGDINRSRRQRSEKAADSSGELSSDAGDKSPKAALEKELRNAVAMAAAAGVVAGTTSMHLKSLYSALPIALLLLVELFVRDPKLKWIAALVFGLAAGLVAILTKLLYSHP